MRKRGFGKKGSEATQKVLLILFQAIFATLIAVSLFSYVKNVETNQAFEKKFLSRDISLLISALYSLPGDTKVVYDQDSLDLKLFSYEFSDFEVKIRGLVHETGTSAVVYPYLVDTILSSSFEKVEGKDKIGFQKQGDKVNLGKIEDIEAMDCPEVPKVGFKKIVIDPGHGDSDRGLIGPTLLEEQELTSTISKALGPWFQGAILTRPLEKGNREVTIEERVKKAREGDFVISIHAGFNPDITINEVIVYYPAGDRVSMGIACDVAWKIRSNSPVFTGSSYRPLPANMIKDSDPYSVIAEGHGIVVEVGNIYDPLMPFHLNAVIKGIGEGVR